MCHSERMTDAELSRLSEICQAATPGPWTVEHEAVDRTAADDECSGGLGLYIREVPEPMLRGHYARAADAAFIAAARTAMPRLLAEVQALRTELAGIADLRDPSRLIRTLLETPTNGDVFWFGHCTYDVSETNEHCDCGWPAVAEIRYDDGAVWPLCATHLKRVLETSD